MSVPPAVPNVDRDRAKRETLIGVKVSGMQASARRLAERRERRHREQAVATWLRSLKG